MLFAYYRGEQLARHQQLPGVKRFLFYLRIYGKSASPVDRSGVIKFPVRTHDFCPLPAMRIFAKRYDEVCDERAADILLKADRLDTSIYVFWSGGIDSTTVLVSFLKNATPAQLEKFVVFLDENSIAEYPEFYRRHIRGKLRCLPAARLPYLIGSKNLLVFGEHNDQLFGSDVVSQVGQLFGHGAILQPFDPNLFSSFFVEKMDDAGTARWYADLICRLAEGATVPLKTNHDVFWWINFAVKWQSVYFRMLRFVAGRNISLLSPEYLENYYTTFFSSEDFQLWGLNNLDRKIGDTWRSYKWLAKEAIYGFTKDADYRDNKMKRGSLQHLIWCLPSSNFIDSDFKFHETVSPEEFYEGGNSFVS